MKVKDMMTRSVECVWPQDTLQEAASRMKEMKIDPLPVCDLTHIVGTLTDRDIAVRAAAGRDPRTTKVSDVMTREVITCYDDDQLEEAERLMQSRLVRRILVVNRDDRPVGILSLGDLSAETSNPQRVGSVRRDQFFRR
jgi:predicted transcriptional regulator